MPLSPGHRVGPYEIVAALGAGGMGEVYRARDARLDREVAIKVLPASVADDPDRRARFEREAKAVAALSHPNILALHDIGEADLAAGAPGARGRVLYAVTELLDGTTLRERLADGPMPVRKAIETAVQIARGLAGAHDRGIVHRDLKPENIFLLDDGRVKILDFGLAKSLEPIGAPASAAATATSLGMTDPGTVLGTVGYMAPEQIRGQAIDARADLFAFGAVLYEMLAGRRAFQRDTAAETMTAILREDPPELTSSRVDLPPALDRIVRHCLEKNPAERFQTARDVAFALDALSGSATGAAAATSGSTPVAAQAPPRGSARATAIAAALLLAGIAIGYALTTWLRPHAAPPPITFESRTWDPQWMTNARFAPDGQTIIYSAAPAGNIPSLFVSRKGAFVAQPLGPPGTHLLSVSSTGELAVITNARYAGHRLFTGTLSRMTMDGAARPWLERVREADWSPDGSTLAIVRDLQAKDRLEYPIDHVLYESEGRGYLSDPRVSPDGTQVAFLDHPARYDDRGWLKVVDRSGKVRTLAGEFWGAEGVVWSPDGSEVFVSSATAQTFGYFPHAVNVAGTPVLRQAFPSIKSAEVMDIAADGRLLVNASETTLSIRALVPGETVEREFPWLELPLAVDMSADGSWLLFSDESQTAGLNYAVALRRTDGTPAVRLGEGNAVGLSPDAKFALGSVPSPAPGHYMLYPTGAGEAAKLDFSPITAVENLAWMPDGRLFFCGDQQAQRRCYVRPAVGGTATPVTPAGIVAGWPAPDGRTLLGRTAEGAWKLIDGDAAPRDVPGDHASDRLVGWSADSRAVFVIRSPAVPAVVERLDLTTGAAKKEIELMPPDRAGVMAIITGRFVADGRGYSYSYWRQVTTAVIVNGVIGPR